MAARKPARTKCPSCGGHSVVPIVYGLPTPEAMEAAARGEFELGGCIIDDLNATRRCRDCGWDNATTVPETELWL